MPLKDKAERQAYHKTYHAEWYQKNKEKVYTAKQERRNAVREWFNGLKGSLKCSKCPEDHPGCLDFHHVDGSTKEYGVFSMVNRGCSIQTIEKELAKCVVLCSNCHRKHHYDERGQHLS